MPNPLDDPNTETDDTEVEGTQDETESGSENSSGSDPSTSTTETPGDFDPAALEQAFDLPPGTLIGAKDEESALAAVRSYTDRLLVEGLRSKKPEVPATPEKKPAAEAKAESSGGNAEIEALRAKLETVESKLAAREKADEEQRRAQIAADIDDEVDSWGSEAFGTSKNRTYKQQIELNKLLELAGQEVIGRRASGQPDPAIKPLLRRLRLFQDETYKPSKKKSSGGALGTPGGSRHGAGGDKTPRNIHEAVIGQR